MPQVENHVASIGLGERVAVHAGAGGRRQFNVDSVIRKQHTVIAGTRFLLVMRKPCAITFARFVARRHLQFSHRGNQQNVSQVGATRAREVVVRKASQIAVGIVVAGTAVPGRIARVRRQLDHAKRHGCPRINVAVLRRADQRIDVVHR